MEPTLALRSAALLPPPAVSAAARSVCSLLHRNPTCSSASGAGLWRPILGSGRRNGFSISSGSSYPIVEGGEDEEDETLSFLSLSEKPDRSLAVLDDYELEELDSDPPNHKSGYVAVLGKPNVGKSTLSNQMIGQKLSIVTDKPQTTRHRILGICSEAEYQMILYDTPGVIEKQMHKLDSMMMRNVRSAAINADCALVVVDASKMPQKIDEILEEGVSELKDKLPILLVLNKKDLIKPGEIAKKLEWYQKFTHVDDVIPVSAKYGAGVDDVKDWILSKLPLGPSYYPKDIASEHPERFFVAEIVREKIFMQYRKEVPYACQVNVVTYISRPTSKEYIRVEIVVEKESQKIILIGKEGKALKVLATASRLDIEDFLQKKVYLEVEVKVKGNWRQDEDLLRNYGYDEESGLITEILRSDLLTLMTGVTKWVPIEEWEGEWLNMGMCAQWPTNHVRPTRASAPECLTRVN